MTSAFDAATRTMSRETLGGASSLSTAHQNLLQKQHEHQGLVALRDASAELLDQIEKLAGMSNIMADGGEGASSSSYCFTYRSSTLTSISTCCCCALMGGCSHR